jgi:cob(I)alamin adenosyltransferase
MSDAPKPFHDPHVAINRVYTKKGDQGQTSLVGGQKVDKDDARIEAYGTIDELNSFVGAARHEALLAAPRAEGAQRERLETIARSLLRVQHELFNLGSVLATLPGDLHPKQPRITDAEVVRLEAEMDDCQDGLPPLRSFVLPGGSRLNVELHLCRTVCRRAERLLVRLGRSTEIDVVDLRYVNRLSDAFFVWSRAASAAEGLDEVLWEPNRAASGEG